MKKELLTGSRGSRKTLLNQKYFNDIMKHRVKNAIYVRAHKSPKVIYIESLIKENEHQQKVINRLSRKIQRLKRISFRNKEITLILYCIDLVIQNFGENRELEKIYNRLYLQRKEHIDNEKKGF